MDFEMSSQTLAIRAVDVLRAAGYEGAAHSDQRGGIREHVIGVPTGPSGVSFEVLQLIRGVDADAQPVG